MFKFRLTGFEKIFIGYFNNRKTAQDKDMNRRLNIFTAFMIIFAAILMHLSSLIPRRSEFCFSFADTNETTRCVYLTFDDGPSDRVTPKILDVLDCEDVKATFFIVGKNAERRRYLVEREFNSGHTVAVHSYSHEYREIYSSPAALIADIKKCNDLIYDITGTRSAVYRFPGGSYGLPADLLDAVIESGMRYVDWNASTRDAEIWNASPDQLLSAAVSSSSDQNCIVLLCHDSTTKTSTAEALRGIIQYYKSNGYIFKTF